MLVRAFQIKIRRIFKPWIRFENGIMRCTGIEPDIERILKLFIACCLATQQLRCIQAKPCFDALLLHSPCHLFQEAHRIGMRLVGLFVNEERHGHSPVALA